MNILGSFCVGLHHPLKHVLNIVEDNVWEDVDECNLSQYDNSYINISF